METVLTANNIYKTFPPARKNGPETKVLHDISLDVKKGEMLAIVGPSGSGKSTLLYCMSGLEPLSSGSVSVLGHDLAKLSRTDRAKLRRDRIGFVFQNFNLIDSLSAQQNIELPARLAKRSVNNKMIDDVIEHVGLEKRGGYHPNQLSGGEQQRVAIARVLAAKPTLVFADEPTGSLDTKTGRIILDMLREAVDEGSSVVIVTHDLELASLADRVIVLSDGAVRDEISHPTPERVLQSFNRFSSNKKADL